MFISSRGIQSAIYTKAHSTIYQTKIVITGVTNIEVVILGINPQVLYRINPKQVDHIALTQFSFLPWPIAVNIGTLKRLIRSHDLKS